MINIKSLLFVLGAAALMTLTSCADEKSFEINGKDVVVEPYGWANEDAKKNDSIVYAVNVGNVVLDVIFCETIVVPVILTGSQLYEPIRKK